MQPPGLPARLDSSPQRTERKDRAEHDGDDPAHRHHCRQRRRLARDHRPDAGDEEGGVDRTWPTIVGLTEHIVERVIDLIARAREIAEPNDRTGARRHDHRRTWIEIRPPIAHHHESIGSGYWPLIPG